MLKTLLAGMVVLWLTTLMAYAAPPLGVYGELPIVENITLSPDGKAFAFVSVDGDKRRTFVDTIDGKVLQTVSLGMMKTRYLKWAGNDHVIVFVSTTIKKPFVYHFKGNLPDWKYEMFTAIGLNAKTGTAMELLTKSRVTLGNVLEYYGSSNVNGVEWGYFKTQSYGNRFIVGLFKVNLDNGVTSMIDDTGRYADNWVLDGQARVIARSAFHPATDTWALYDGQSGNHVAFSKISSTSDLEVLGLGRTPDTVLVEDDSGDEDTLMEVPLDGARKPQAVFRDMNISQEYFSPSDRTLLGARDERSGEAEFFDPLLKKRFGAACKPFAKYHPTLVSYDVAFDRLIIFTDGGDDSGTYWFVDLATGKAHALAQSRPKIAPADVGPASFIRYKASDGLQLEAVLTLPPGRKAERLPLIVLPHGGPIGVSDNPGFDWWAQAFASQGYAVLQPNYRGSGGYGAALRRAGYGEWGRKMQSDLSDGVTFLASQGLVDPHRACIVGGSYGGYAALAGVTLQHGVYRCAVSYAGVSDLGAMMWDAGRNQHDSVSNRWEQRALGVTWSGDASLAQRSPARQASNADAPILLIHGRDDTVVPISASEEMDASLRKANKPHVFIRLDGEDHWLSTPHTRIQMLQASMDFVMKYNPPA